MEITQVIDDLVKRFAASQSELPAVSHDMPRSSTKMVILSTHIPVTLPGRQTIRRTTYSIAPAKQFRKDGNKYAIFVLDDFKKPVNVTIKVEANIYRYDLATATASPLAAALGEKERRQWLAHEYRLEKNAVVVKAAAETIEGKDDIEVARKILSFIWSTLRRSNFTSKALGAVGALREKRGDCTDHADLFVALCRAKGIPARICDGYVMIPPKKGDTARHMWAEFYSKRLGWIPVDPFLRGFKLSRSYQLRNRYIYSTRTRNDKILEDNEFCVYRYYGAPLLRFEDPVVIHSK